MSNIYKKPVAALEKSGFVAVIYANSLRWQSRGVGRARWPDQRLDKGVEKANIRPVCTSSNTICIYNGIFTVVT